MRCLLLALLLPLALLAAADPKTPPKGGGNIAGSGKADAEVAFKRQAGQVPAPAGANPGFLGAYVWGGRADEEYRPFFQWELRLQSGTAELKGLRARTITLNPDRSAAFTGGWTAVGAVAAGAKKDFAIKQNCSAFSSYQVDLEWDGGKASYVASDKVNVPVCLADLVGQPFLVATAYMHDPDVKKKPWVATWHLWNLGGVAATDTVQTVSLYDQGQKVLKTVEVKTGTVKPNSALECKATLPQAPAGYVSIGVSARCADASVASGPAAGFTGAKELEVAHVRLDGAHLRARARNGLDRALAGVVVTITLLDAGNKPVKAIAMPALDLAAGAEGDLAAPHGGVTGFAGYEIGWSMAQSTAPAAPAPAASGDEESAGPVLTVRGLEFRQKQAVAEGGSLWLKGDLANRTGRALSGLTATFVAKGGGRSTELVFRQETLADGDSAVVAIEAPGLERLETLELRWTAK